MLDSHGRREPGIERSAGEHVYEEAASDLVGMHSDRAGFDELHRRQPSSSPLPNRSSFNGPCARIPIASISAGTNARMLSGSASGPKAQPCKSIAARVPHGESS